MKFIFSFCMLLSTSLFARDLVVINYAENRRADADFVANTLQHQLALPEKFLSFRSGPCLSSDHAITTICIQSDGAIEVKQVKVEVMRKLLNAFGETL